MDTAPPESIVSVPRRVSAHQRLFVCLDGTWNTRDDCTNVFHLFNMIREGPLDDTWTQLKYYDQGVGTGVLDGFMGGAFGKGLDQNVKEAINWLIEHYNDGDEIYVFGFSRGAYTARSLVGFIAQCGLLRRGAPLTVNQLWEGYRALGRQGEDIMNWWERLLGVEEPAFRQISELTVDEWSTSHRPTVPEAEMNLTEKLLIHWSRRVKIKFMGLFDTVGAMGVEALAIPGLRSQLAVHHNMRLSSIVQRACHALALDEHRSTFNNTPYKEYLPHHRPMPAPNQRVAQRWFVGAHSNVGGGYANNLASLIPLRWVVDAMLKLPSAPMLEQEAVDRLNRDLEPASLLHPVNRTMTAAIQEGLVDSYSRFAAPVWVHLVRGKRNYRMVAPPPETRGNPVDSRPGYTLRSVGDDHDASVGAMAFESAANSHVRPNLVEYAERKSLPFASDLGARCHHEWEGAKRWGAVSLVAWATLAALGVDALNDWLHIFKAATVAQLAVFAAFMVWIDWAESRVNFSLARRPDSGFWKAVLACLYWQRFGGLLLVLAGVVHLANKLMEGKFMPGCSLWVLAAPLLAALPLRLTDVLIARKGSSSGVKLATHWPVAALLLALVAILWGAWPDCYGLDEAFAGSGGLLLSVALFFYFQNSMNWVGQPLGNARLSNILRLQKCFSAAAIQKRLETWRDTLVRDALPEDHPTLAKLSPIDAAANRLHHVLEETLWRDILGFVPVYTAFFLVTLQLGAESLGKGCTVWPILALGLPLLTALLDQIENAIHLRFSRQFANGSQPRSSSLLATVAAVATSFKTLGFVSCLGLSVWIMGDRFLHSRHDHSSVGWLALIIGSFLALSFGIHVASALKEFFVPAKQRVHTLRREEPNQDGLSKKTKLA